MQEGAYVFIAGRREAELDQAVALLGKNVEAVQGDATRLALLCEKVRVSKGKLDILVANSGFSEAATLDDITEEHFDKYSASMRGRRCSPCRRRYR